MHSHVTTPMPTDEPQSAADPRLSGPVDRRSALRVGLVLGAGALFAGCSSNSSSSRVRRTPMSPTGTARPAPTATASNTPYGEPEFVSHKPAWLDDWRAGQDSTPVGIEPRTSWAKYGPNPRLADRMGTITRITVHHDGMNAFTASDRASAARRLENIRAAHVGNGWADIGYHYVIDPGGRVWQGRPTSLQGAHVRQNNPGNLGIMVMGNYNEQRVSDASSNALNRTLAGFMNQYRIPKNRVYTHRELVSTECPGTSLQRLMDTLRSGALA